MYSSDIDQALQFRNSRFSRTGEDREVHKKCHVRAGVVVFLPYACYTVLTSLSPPPSSLLKPIFERCPHYRAKDMATEFSLKR